MNLSRRCILGKILTGLFLLKFPGHLSSGPILDQESEQKIRLGYTSFIKELQKSKNLLLQKLPSTFNKSFLLLIELFSYLYEIFLVIFIFASYFTAFILMVGSFYRLFRVSKRKSKQISYK